LLGALQDIAGDAFCFVTVRKQSHKQWVGRMIQPYLICFVLACAVSLAGMAVKTLLLLEKFQSRHARQGVRLGKMVIKNESLRDVKTEKTVAELQAKFDAHKLSRRKDYCGLLVVFFEDLPMGMQLLRPPLGLSESLVQIPPSIWSDPGSYAVQGY
jgi:hypothetical protein